MIARAQDMDAIGQLLQGYFDGLYHADPRQLADVFHKDARYINTAEQDYTHINMADYFAIVDQRTSPASSGEERHDEIISIEFGSARLAFARVELTMLNRRYTDFLTLIKTDDQWRVIAKVFDYLTLPSEPTYRNP